MGVSVGSGVGVGVSVGSGVGVLVGNAVGVDVSVASGVDVSRLLVGGVVTVVLGLCVLPGKGAVANA